MRLLGSGYTPVACLAGSISGRSCLAATDFLVCDRELDVDVLVETTPFPRTACAFLGFRRETGLAAAFPDPGHKLPLLAVCTMTFPATGFAVKDLQHTWHRHPNSFERSVRATFPPKNLDGCHLQ
jgi:hypothetical protein